MAQFLLISSDRHRMEVQMIRLRTVPIVSCIRRHGLLFALAAFVIGLVTIGCGGGGDNGGGQFIPATGWKQQNATYVGRAACRDCHANIADQYAEQPMGTMPPGHADNNCGSCHATTGFGQPTGGQLDGSTPLLDGIGCESCHGPGSLHIAAASIADREATITRVPPDKTCTDCHGDRKSTPDGYRPGALDEPYVPITAETLRNSTANGIRGPHHASAAFLFGRGGYNIMAPMASPHSTIPNTCLNCHQKTISPVTGKVDHGAEAQVPVINTANVNCTSCHGGRVEDHLVQDGVKALMIELAGANEEGEPNSSPTGGLFGDFVTRHELTISSNANPDDPYLQAYKGARNNYMHVRGDGSMGVHNPGFAKKLLEDAKELLSD